MSRYNLIDEKWIPVRFPDGSRNELGIRDTLLGAATITAIEDPSPLVVAGMHRFLLAVLYRALEGPTDIVQARELFRNGLPHHKIETYFKKWRDRFWLIDDEHPFGQIPGFEPKTWRAWTALAAEHNADNAKVLFDHTDVQDPGSIPEAAAARWILATQTFSVSCGKSELSHTGTAPSATAAMVLPIGRNLNDTLLFSLVPQNREIIAEDLALWERSPESLESLKSGIKRSIGGYADRYTWRIRSVRLLSNITGQIEKLAFASGIESASPDHTDPMHGYRIDEKNGRRPIQFTERGIWRDFDALLPDGSKLAPQVVEHATYLTRSDSKRFPSSVTVVGQANDKAKIKFWRMEQFVLPIALSGDRFIRPEIRKLLTEAEDTQRTLWSACRLFARNKLSRGEREPTGKDVSDFIAQMPVIGRYWSMLESRFHEILAEYTLDREPEDIRCQWLKFVHEALQVSWEQHRAAACNGDAWNIRALVKAEAPIRRELKKLNEEIVKLES